MFFLLKKYELNGKIILDLYDTFGIRESTTEIDEFSKKLLLFENGYKVKSEPQITNNIGVGVKVYRKKNSVLIKSDSSGREPIFYKLFTDGFIVSNSLNIIVLEMRDHGISIDPDQAVINAQINDLWIFETAAFHNTMVKGVKICPSSHFLEIKITNGSVILNKNDGENTELTYTDLLYKTIDITRSFLNSIFDEYEYPILSLSGGQDSRILLAAIITLDESKRNKLTIHSIKDKAGDFGVVQAIVNRYNIPLNQYPHKVVRDKLDPEAAISRWLLFNLGISFQNNFSDKFLKYSNAVVIRGGQVNASYYPIILKRWLRDIRKKSENEYLKYSKLISDFISPDIDYAIDNHYKYFRYRFHYGQINYLATINPLIVDPLINPYYEMLSEKIDFKEKESGRICRDMCKILCPEMLSFGFDKESNRINSAYQNQCNYKANSFSKEFFPIFMSKLSKVNFPEAKKSSKFDLNKRIIDLMAVEEINISNNKKIMYKYLFK